MKQTKTEILKGCTKEITSSKVINNSTLKIQYKDGSEAIRFHNTDVITILSNENIVLNSGGYRTPTTKDRINTYSNARVHQKEVWYMRDGSAFYDGIIIDNEGNVISKKKKVDLIKLKKIKEKIKKFVDRLNKDFLPLPNAGDCWYCCLHDKDNKTMGELSNNNDHIHQHLKQNYLHGSLLVNSMRETGYSDAGIQLHYQMKVVDTFKRSLRRYLQKRLITNIAVK